MSADVIAAAPNATAQPLPPAVEPRTRAWKAGKDGSFGFRNAINPLQHIPIVSAIYRRLTGDVPGNIAQLAGDTLFGGPIGFGAGLLGIAFKEETGNDPGEMALALVTGSDTATKEAAATAVATPPTAEAQQAAATDPAPASAPAPALAPAVPAHPPIPLHRAPTASPTPSAGAHNPSAAETAFLARNALLQRGITGNRIAPATSRNITAPVPLQLSGQAAQVMPFRPPPRAMAASPAPTPLATAAAPQSPPADIARRMQEALDKYQRLEAQRAGTVDLRQ